MKQIFLIFLFIINCNPFFSQIRFENQWMRTSQPHAVLGNYIADKLSDVVKGDPGHPLTESGNYGQMDVSQRIFYIIELWPRCETNELKIEQPSLPYDWSYIEHGMLWPIGCELNFEELKSEIVQFYPITKILKKIISSYVKDMLICLKNYQN